MDSGAELYTWNRQVEEWTTQNRHKEGVYGLGVRNEHGEQAKSQEKRPWINIKTVFFPKFLWNKVNVGCF